MQSKFSYSFKHKVWRRIEVVVTGLTRNQLYLFWYRGFESHRLRHIMARCEPQNKKATSVAFFILLLFARHYNCSDGGRPKYVTLDFHLAIPSLRSLRIPPSPPWRRRKATYNTASIMLAVSFYACDSASEQSCRLRFFQEKSRF